MKRNELWLCLTLLLSCSLMACSDKDSAGSAGAPFDANAPISITDFYPDSGGIATPMIISGTNFGTDTTGLKVFFVDEDNVRHRGGLVSTNGEKIYCYVPSGLTYKRRIGLEVERTVQGKSEPVVGTSERPFWYKTQTSVTTVVGQVSTEAQPTKAATLTTTTFSAPLYICLDDEDNIFIVERRLGAARPQAITCLKSDGSNSKGNVLRASQEKNEVVMLSEDQFNLPNAPAFSDEPGLEAVYVPSDEGMGFLQLGKSTDYQPRSLLALKNDQFPEIDKNNWKYCFVVNKIDKQIYTVMHGGQLVRINPRTRRTEVLLKKVGIHGYQDGGTDSYLAFSPIEPNKLFVCQSDNNEIWTVDVDQLEGKDIDNYHGEAYAGRGCYEGLTAGRGWEDGLLKNAKFYYPRQICFTKDGKLYIADSANSCIRSIDTSLPADKATVTTVVGIPGSHGHQDGGPDIAKFRYPYGVAVSADGSIVYVADTGNRVIRKLSIE
jgi:hypothetical protein